EHPDLAVVDDGRVVGPGRPRGGRDLPPPLLAVGGRPDVVLEARVVAEVIVLRAAEEPEAAFESHDSGGEPGGPPGPVRGLFPRPAVARGPDLVARAVPREPAVVPAAHQPHAIVEDNRHRQVAVLPGGLPGHEVPGLAVGRAPDVTRRG